MSWLRCAFATNKGASVCPHSTSYRKDLVEAAIVKRFREAMTDEHVDRLTALVNDAIARAIEGERQPRTIAAEIQRLRDEGENLVRFLTQGGDSALVRDKLADLEQRIAVLEAEEIQARKLAVRPRSVLLRGTIVARLERLHELVNRDPVAARIEILRHLEGDLVLNPLPSSTDERRAEIAGMVSGAGLLAEETGRLQVVAGGGFEPPTFGL